jgi:hypothetical protein
LHETEACKEAKTYELHMYSNDKTLERKVYIYIVPFAEKLHLKTKLKKILNGESLIPKYHEHDHRNAAPNE